MPHYPQKILCCGLLLATAWCSLAAADSPLAASLQKFSAARNVGLPALTYDFTQATVIAPATGSGPEKKAVTMLVEEVESRTLIRWTVAPQAPSSGATIVVGQFTEVNALLGARAGQAGLDPSKVGAEGYQLATIGSGVNATLIIAGHDSRGVLFGVGHVLRTLRMGPGRAGLITPLAVATTPHYALRGHQLAYRPKPNSYAGWDLPQWEHYIRELAIYGCNAIELLPPRTDDAADSPHFPRPQIDMMVGMSQIAADYGLDVWIWYPAMDDDYSKSATVDFALKEWGDVFRALPRVDAVLVPGGDPGHTPPRLMFPLLEKQTANLRKFHPRATMWLSPQGFNQEDLDYFINYLTEKKPAWLTGAVFAPWVHLDLAEFRRRVPAQYPIRFYPDITHTRNCQYPIADWDRAFVLTETREPISTRPEAMAAILRELQPNTIGAITYSEGCTDDINKTIWSRLSWDPEANVTEILREYARFFINERLTDDFAQGILALERNWRGPLLTHQGVDTTLAQFQAMERAASPRDLQNWRFQMALYRAYFDATVRARLIYETSLEFEANQALQLAPRLGSVAAMQRAEGVLEQAVTTPVAEAWRTRIYQLAEALFQSIHMKLSVPLYRAIAQGRGASLDTLDYPLNNRLWLSERFAAIRQLPDENERLARLHEILNWTNPGPGGFYDDLGNAESSPHLDRGVGVSRDPAFLHTPLDGHLAAGSPPLPLRTSWVDFAWGLNDNPLVMRYSGLDPEAQYQVRVVYPDVNSPAKIRLVANRDIEVHPLIARAKPIAPVSFDIPRSATRDGNLTLTWSRPAGLGGNGSGCSVSEVWLEKKAPPAARPAK